MSDVTFTSWGSAGSIGPSCHVMRFGSFSVGIDYGAGMKEGEEEPEHNGPLDAIIVTHAHRDHAGMLPRAVSRWPRVQTWATFETMSLARWIWEDELNLARIAGRVFPFNTEDIERVSRRTKRLLPGITAELADDLTVTPFSAGHILGAVGLVFTYRGKHYVATGDISLRDHGFVPGAELPELSSTELLIRESTYVGQRTLEARSDVGQRFIARIGETLTHGGRVLIPTLSIDRMPEIFALLFESGLCERWPLWVIGGARPTDIYRDYAVGADVVGLMRRFEHRQHQDETRKSKAPMIILASSGMVASGSPSYSWAVDVLTEPASAILMVNWQDPCMPGGRILSSTSGGDVELPTGTFRRRCHVERFDFSSHAKEDEMEELELRLKPESIIHVHGDAGRIDAFIGSQQPDGPRRMRAVIGAEVAL